MARGTGEGIDPPPLARGTTGTGLAGAREGGSISQSGDNPALVCHTAVLLCGCAQIGLARAQQAAARPTNMLMKAPGTVIIFFYSLTGRHGLTQQLERALRLDGGSCSHAPARAAVLPVHHAPIPRLRALRRSPRSP